MKTPISYYGGKQAILHEILPMIPKHTVYTECFFGGGAVFWAKQPSANETINDKLDMVINFYRVLKTRYSDLKKWIDSSLISRTLHQEAKSIVKGKIECDEVKKAWAFWYVCNFSFANKIGGGYKYSNDMHTCVPETLACKKKEFTEFLANRIEHAYIENNDALLILNSRNSNTAFHYLDPPYMNADQGHYKGYSTEDFTRLIDWCANECKGAFLLSNYPSEIMDQYILQNGWHTQKVNHSSKHGAHVKHKKKMETLVWNYITPKQQQLKIF